MWERNSFYKGESEDVKSCSKGHDSEWNHNSLWKMLPSSLLCLFPLNFLCIHSPNFFPFFFFKKIIKNSITNHHPLGWVGKVLTLTKNFVLVPSRVCMSWVREILTINPKFQVSNSNRVNNSTQPNHTLYFQVGSGSRLSGCPFFFFFKSYLSTVHVTLVTKIYIYKSQHITNIGYISYNLNFQFFKILTQPKSKKQNQSNP